MTLSTYGTMGTTPIGALIIGWLTTIGTARAAIGAGAASLLISALVLTLSAQRGGFAVTPARFHRSRPWQQRKPMNDGSPRRRGSPAPSSPGIRRREGTRQPRVCHQALALFAGDLANGIVVWLWPVLDQDVLGVRDQVVVPDRVRRRSAFRGDEGVLALVFQRA